MYIKSTLFAAVTVLLVFALAASAGAAELTDSEENPISVGAQLEGTSTDTQIVTEGLGTVECEAITVFSELTLNSGSVIETEAIGEAATVNCAAKGKKIKVTDLTMIQWQTFPAFNSGVATITEVVDFPTVTCHFAGELEFTFKTNSDVMTIVNGALEGGGCGEAVLNGNYTWTWKGKPVKFK